MKKIISMLLTIILCFGGIAVCADTEETEADMSDDIIVTAEGKVLQKDVDYYLTYRDNVNVGTATLVVNFIGNYSGTQEKTFNIVRQKSSGGGGGSRIPSRPAATDTPKPTPKPTAIPTQEPNEKTEHIAYIEGYNGLFCPESDMTRAEAATIFARVVSERNNEEIGITYSKFKDVDSSSWYSSYIAYLEKYNVISGYDDSTFRPNNSISRAEFTAICTRFYELFDDISVSGRNVFCDVDDDYWAASYICTDSDMEWIKGYDDGTFRPNNNITRAEVVTIINRVLNRCADEKYVADNESQLNIFKDVSKKHWAYADIVESSNKHYTNIKEKCERWIE